MRLIPLLAVALPLSACGARSELEDGPSGGELGHGGAPSLLPALPQCQSPAGWVPVALGSDHSCTVRIGRVYCWGSNELGQVGNGGDEDALTATPIDVPCGATWLAAGTNHTCAITRVEPEGGEVFCWGANESGQSGAASDTVLLPAPRKVELPDGALALQLVAGARHSCAWTTQGLVCWGNNDHGQLGPWGPGNFGPTKVPDDYLSTSNYVTAGGDVTCSVGSWSATRCWGDDSFGQHGDGVTGGDMGPTALVATVAYPWLGPTYGIGFASSGTTVIPMGWGDGSSGVLGPEVSGITAFPQALPFDLQPGGSSPAMGDGHVCALQGELGEERLACWGRNDRGQLGIGTKDSSALPVQVDLEPDVFSPNLFMAAGREHTCVHEQRYSNTEEPWLPKVYCWGANDHGQLGNGTRDEQLSPARVVGIPADPVLDD